MEWIKFKVSVVVCAVENIPGKKRNPILATIPWVSTLRLLATKTWYRISTNVYLLGPIRDHNSITTRKPENKRVWKYNKLRCRALARIKKASNRDQICLPSEKCGKEGENFKQFRETTEQMEASL